jgi:hypothetical protein
MHSAREWRACGRVAYGYRFRINRLLGKIWHWHSLLPIAYCLLPVAYWLLAIAYCLLPVAYCLLAIGYLLLAIGYWLLSIGYWLLLRALRSSLVMLL